MNRAGPRMNRSILGMEGELSHHELMLNRRWPLIRFIVAAMRHVPANPGPFLQPS
jgi:hypothetical protein